MTLRLERHSEEVFFVVAEDGRQVGRIDKTMHGTWKIVGEDTYGRPKKLLKRLENRYRAQ